MASLLRDRKVDVHILYRSKFGGRRIWAEHECTTGGMEATLKQRQSDVYILEINERCALKVVLEIDFRKVKSYKMRARSWHEVKYDGHLIALRFAENKNFDDFFQALELVLKLYKKFTKPKNDTTFLQEVQMFQLKQLRPVANVRMERAVSLETAEKESPNSRGSSHSDRTPVANSRSLETPARLSELSGIKKLGAGIMKPQNPLPTIRKPKKKDDVGGTVIKNRPLPKIPPTSKPAPLAPTAPPTRISGGDQNAQQGAGMGLTSKTPNTGTSDTSDEESDESLNPRSDYISGTVYASSGDEASEVSRQSDNRSHKLKSSTNQESFTGPPARQVSPLLLPKRRINTKRCPRSGPNHPPTPPSTPPPRQKETQRPPSTIYGTAMEWQCTACTLRNAFSSLNCAACDRIRTDAWGCIDCSKVYSNDVSRCFTCDVWRCQLCSFLNRGAHDTTTLCEACNQR